MWDCTLFFCLTLFFLLTTQKINWRRININNKESKKVRERERRYIRQLIGHLGICCNTRLDNSEQSLSKKLKC